MTEARQLLWRQGKKLKTGEEKVCSPQPTYPSFGKNQKGLYLKYKVGVVTAHVTYYCPV